MAVVRRTDVFAGCLALLLLVVFVPQRLEADHAWGKYHWDADALPVDLDVGDNLSAAWAGHLNTAVDDWNTPTGTAIQSLNLQIVPGSSDPATCDPTLGRIEVCNDAYGDTGWLGIAQIWAQRRGHIVQATTLVNDTYYSLPFYDTYEWRQMVMCQEIAHDFGLDHQDEDFYNTNLGTCMDYTADPTAVSPFNGQDNTAPNQHDYDEIQSVYAHIGGGGGGGGRGGSGGGGGGGGGRGKPQAGSLPDLPDQALQRVPIDSPTAWGMQVRENGRFALYELDLGNDIVLFTFVTWAN
jgi:hypothetical protein